jgi:4-amino-4-deoxy-L-arabinose transferase-like glycosyltransferase
VSSRWLSPVAWIAIAWIMVFWRLGYSTLLDPDEAHYAELTREMMHAGNWLVPLLDGKPLIDKPVLFHWLQGASVFLLGETEFAARLPSALAALALFGLTRWAGTMLLGAEVGEWGAVMFATIPATFALASIALFDMVFATFLFGGVACLLVAATQRSRTVEWCGYALLTLAVMTKGPVALGLVALFVITASIVSRDARARLGTLHWKLGLSAAAIAASPWFLWMYGRFGDAFIQGYVLAGNLWYFTQPREFSGRAISHTFYARAFAGAFFPWSAVVMGRGVDLIRGRGGPLKTEETLLWGWVAVIIGFFSLARFKLDHYIFPAAPACCLLAAHAWRAAAEDTEGRLRATRLSVHVIAGALIVGGAFGTVYLFKLELDLPAIAIALPMVLAAGGAALMTDSALDQWRVPRTAAVPVAMLLVAYAIVVAIGFPALERTRPTARVAYWLTRSTAATAPVGLYRLERWRASLRYYIGRPIQRLETSDDLLSFLSQPRPVYVVMLRREYDDLRKQGVPLSVLHQRRAVVGTTGRGLRRQRWGSVIVATNASNRHSATPAIPEIAPDAGRAAPDGSQSPDQPPGR